MSECHRGLVEAPPAPGLWLCWLAAPAARAARAGRLGVGEPSCSTAGWPRGLEVFLFSFSVGFLWHVSTSLTHAELPIDGFCLLSAPPGGAAGPPAPLQLAAGCIVPVRGAEAALGNDS